MTPEERAAAAYEDWREGTTVGHPDNAYRIDDLPLVIAAHIRAAENDALERAAAWHDQQATTEETKAGKSPDQFVARGIRLERAEKHRTYAASIRALKHHDPK